MRPIMLSLLAACLLSGAAGAKEPAKLLSSPLGIAFGSAPAMWGLALSPDGSKISFLQKHPEGPTIGRTVDLTTGASAIIVVADPERFDVSWCEWANDTRLLCGLHAPILDAGIAYAATRLIAVDSDGSDQRVLLGERLDNESAQIQDGVIDWLPDDPQHVLVQEPGNHGYGVSRLDIYEGDLSTVERPREEVFRWVSDGSGEARLFRRTTQTDVTWYVRDPETDDWSVLRESPLTDIEDNFSPIGFGVDPDELLYFDVADGRTALFGLNLKTGTSQTIYANEMHDVASVRRLGKDRRLVAATYIDDRPRYEFFDKRIDYVQGLIAAQFPDKLVGLIDEDWNQRYYLAYVGSDTDPGAYYRIDANTLTFSKLADTYPSLGSHSLTPMHEIRYKAGDGTEIPAYLTVPGSADDGPRAAIVLPHGGPSARDYWSYDYLAQFFAANGYAVLQSNYRGSSGYGADWEGDGAFKGWRQAVSDINDGARYLVDEGIADPERLCVVGWSYGGYAALMSSIESPELYRCTAAVAAVSDPKSLGAAARNFVGGRAAQLFIGLEDDVVRAGSPLERAAEIRTPLLMFHAERDLNVPFRQSTELAKALRKADADFDFIEYEFAEHDIEPERYRIDLLTRLAAFLDQHIGHGG